MSDRKQGLHGRVQANTERLNAHTDAINTLGKREAQMQMDLETIAQVIHGLRHELERIERSVLILDRRTTVVPATPKASLKGLVPEQPRRSP